LEAPTMGQVIINGKNLYGCGSAGRAKIRNTLMGYVFQSYFLLPELTAMENVLLPSHIKGSRATERAAALLERVGLSHRLDHLPYELSGGEQQRVAVARALINDPPFLFADEPTGNLDATNGQDIMKLLFSFAEESRKTLVVVTHDRKLAEMGDRIVELAAGKILV
jgi:predicted ABC-type transport system involved in lysophospholipase L1 biosynthesis ATPase subunit